MVRNQALLALLPCRCKGGISHDPELALGLGRYWNISQRISQSVVWVVANMLDSNEAGVRIMSNQPCCSACGPCNI